MPPKRKYSTRVARGTPKGKRQAQSSPHRAQSVHEEPPIPSPSPEPQLPFRIVENAPLPTVEYHQRAPDDLLQSLCDSGVLAASLQRSRVKWLGEGLFERYWTKPTKKKGQVVEPPNNPAKDTMHKIGTCQIIIDPHIFEAILYSIRDPHAPLPALPPAKITPTYGTPPAHRTYHYPLAASQNTAGNMHRHPHNAPPVASVQIYHQSNSQGSQNSPTPTPGHVWSNSSYNNMQVSSPLQSPAPQTPLIATSPMNGSPGTQTQQAKPISDSSQQAKPISDSSQPVISINPVSNQQQTVTVQINTPPTAPAPNSRLDHQPSQVIPSAAPQVMNQSTPQALVTQNQPSSQNQPQPAPSKPSQDPVIQMLAQRASTNLELKVLMKIVASGDASTEELKTFQDHIDELTKILHNRRAARAAPATKPIPVTASAPPMVTSTPHLPGPHILTPMSSTGSTTASQQSSPYPANLVTRPPSNTPSTKPHAYYNVAPSLPAKPKQFVPPKPEITGIAIEFIAGSGDRFLFPRHSILEFIPQLRQVMASFLVTRRGSEAASASKADEDKPSRYKEEETYHQPVTIRIATDHPRVMENISRAVATYDEARKSIEQTIANTLRADDVHLAMRLPQTVSSSSGEETLISTSTPAASQMPALPPEKKQRGGRHAAHKQKVDPFQQACLVCFSPLAGSIAELNGTQACTNCFNLAAKQAPTTAVITHRQTTHVFSGPRTLALPVS